MKLRVRFRTKPQQKMSPLEPRHNLQDVINKNQHFRKFLQIKLAMAHLPALANFWQMQPSLQIGPHYWP